MPAIASLVVLTIATFGAGSALAQQPQAEPPAVNAPAAPAEPAPSASTAPAEGPDPTSAAAAAPAATTVGGVAEAPQTFPPRPVQPPADPTASEAFGVLAKHCAGCHQGGRLTITAPAAFGNILRLDELADAPHLVHPGNPDASRLYLSMLRRRMPPNASGAAAGPTAEEIAKVRTWIEGLAPRPVCRDRRLVTPEDHAAALARVATEAAAGATNVRFLSIAHLHDGCVSFEALAAYRHAIAKLVNSLSWKPKPVAVTPVDPARTLFRLNLDDIGWLPEHWERIMRSRSDPLGMTPPLPAASRKPFGTEIPIARADWLADTVLRAPLYYDVLGLPGTGPEIQKILQIGQGPTDEPAARAGVATSSFSIASSLVDRVTARTGGLWQAYHRFAREGATDLSSLGAKPPGEAVPHHASRFMFTLPNGLPAFYIVGQRGDRLDAMPPDIARPAISPRGEMRAGLDCMACHGRGPVSFEPGPTAAAAISSNLAKDALAIAEAHRRIGMDPELSLDGVDPLVALAQEYARPLGNLRAAAELFVEPATLVELANRDDSPASQLARRLVQGLVTRAEIEARGSELMGALGVTGSPSGKSEPSGTGSAARPSASAAAILSVDPGPGIVLSSSKSRYKKGDALEVMVRVATDCHLTLISINQKGRGTVIYPSDFETNTLLVAGQELRLPGQGAPYTFRLNESGRERIVALCNEVGAATDAISHDFERQRFTDLGDYASFIAKNASGLGVEPAREDAASGAAARQRTRRRGPVQTSEQAVRPEQISRTAITIIVE